MLLAINWADFGIKAAQLLLSLSILIVFHEFGHYITARWFKCRVEKFYLFFDPWFSLFKKKVGETEYGIGWLPLGGYVKISGMIDESMDKEAMKLPAQPWEFRSKPAWQRLIIMIGGVTVNVILAFIIYAMILFVWGEDKIPMETVKNGVWITDSLMYDAGIRNGDKIVSIGGKPVAYFDDVNKNILTAKQMVVDRNGVQKNIIFPVDLVGKLVESKRRRRLVEMRVTPLVGEFDKKDTSFASRSGLKNGDKIVAVDSVTVNYFDELIPLVAKK
ncbi:MAG TPA: site-2 protease family protein, partial [Lacibacter sp.]|nr:site-2 protease family protein [Lacibacter sp.]